MKKILVGTLLFLFTFVIYKYIYPNPRNWYDHYLYLAKSFTLGRLDLVNFPLFYHDIVKFEGKYYLPFPPLPAFILIPFVLFFKSVTQQQVSILIGSLNIFFLFLLICRFTKKSYAFAISLFIAFGTVHFWSSVVGTTWYFAHNVAFLFLTLSLLSHFSSKHFLSGIFLGMAILSRYPIFFGISFFIMDFIRIKISKKNLFLFLSPLLFLSVTQIFYNYFRFGNIFEMGYRQLYKMYSEGGYAYSILKIIAPQISSLGYFDIRNIPVHLFTFILMPPIIPENILNIKPSPIGMGMLFTSPLLLIALKPSFKNVLERNLFFGAVSVALVNFLHYSQGWVQFGYRFLLDFLPFLVIIFTLRFKPSKVTILLMVVSIIVNFWGTKQGINLGW